MIMYDPYESPPHSFILLVTHSPILFLKLSPREKQDERQRGSAQHTEVLSPSPEVPETTLVPSTSSSILQTHVLPIGPFFD